jgi:hypothetical protein
MTPQKVFWIVAVCLLGFQLFLRYDHWGLEDGRRAEYDMLTGKTVVLEKGQRRNLVQWLTGATPRKHRPARFDDTDPDEEELLETDTPVAMSSTTADSKTERAARKRLDSDRFEFDDSAAYGQDAKPAKKATKASSDPVEPATRKAREPVRPEPVDKKTKKAQTDTVSVAPTPEDTVDQLAKAPPAKATDPARKKPRTAANDLNGDGDTEQIIQSPPTRSGVIDFSVVTDGKEVFYGKGYQLRVLTTRNKGWSDLAVVKPNDQVEVFKYNPDVGNYQPAPQ